MSGCRVKICGVRDAATALACARAGAEFVGVVFAAASPRTVDEAVARSIVAALETSAPDCTPVALFVDQPRHPALGWWPGIVQLHGSERLDEVRSLTERGVRTWKAIPWDEERVRLWSGATEPEAIVVDGPKAGSGISFDHEALALMRGLIAPHLVLAGGLTPASVGGAIRTVRPWCVDVSSGVERERGVKDIHLIEAFIAAARQAARP